MVNDLLVLVFCGLFFLFPGRLEACFNLAHEWTVVAKSPRDATGANFGLSEAFNQFRDKFVLQQVAIKEKFGSITIAGVFWGEENTPAEKNQLEQIRGSIPADWLLEKETALLRENDHDALASFSRLASTPFSATVQVKEVKAEELDLLDLIYFSWAIIRIVIREEVVMIVKVLNKSGDLVFLDEIKVSPTILVDVVFSTAGNFIGYLEKHDSRPARVDFGEIFYQTSSESYDLRPESMRLPDLPTSIPMPEPIAASGSHPSTGIPQN